MEILRNAFFIIRWKMSSGNPNEWLKQMPYVTKAVAPPTLDVFSYLRLLLKCAISTVAPRFIHMIHAESLIADSTVFTLAVWFHWPDVAGAALASAVVTTPW